MWNKNKEEIKRLQEELKTLTDTHTELVNDNQMTLHKLVGAERALEDTMQELVKLKAQHPDRKGDNVTEPWMRIEVDGVHSVKGLKVEIDWNEAMVQHMKDSGHNVRDENLLMQHFLVQLYEHVVQILEYKAIEESEHNRSNEFE